MSFVFVIVGKNDNPVYEHTQLPTHLQDDERHMMQFALHGSLDLVDEAIWKNSSMNLKTVDKWGDRNISAFVSAGNMKFLLLHDLRNDDGIKQFFSDVHELYVKILLNPFYIPNTSITSPVFDARVKALAKRLLKS